MRETESESRLVSRRSLVCVETFDLDNLSALKAKSSSSGVFGQSSEKASARAETQGFSSSEKTKKVSSALETTSTELESIFPDVLLVWKELSCPSRLFETDVVRPSERCHSAAQRLLSDLQKHLAATSPEAASFPPPPLPSPPPSPLLQLLSSLFFLFPLITNTCGLFPPAAAKPRVSAAFPSELSALARWDGSEP